MTPTTLPRRLVSAAIAVVIAAGAMTNTASAGERRRTDGEVGTAVAIGVGAAILGAVLANKKSHHRDEREFRHAPPPPRHDHPAPHVSRPPKYEYQNSGR